jgi:Periplasmic component of the Tol biopolymer transport system
MGGSLWRQTIGDDQARELTHAGGYDYQPDWSHDGRHIIFTRYQKDAIELWQLDLQTGTEVALTSHGDINLEPRYSPNDHQIAFVSTADSGHFNLYLAEVADDRLSGARRLVPEHTSNVYRYYYAHRPSRSILLGLPMVNACCSSRIGKSLMEQVISGAWL